MAHEDLRNRTSHVVLFRLIRETPVLVRGGPTPFEADVEQALGQAAALN